MANSNIYLNLPDNISPGSSASEKYLLENNVETSKNLSSTVLNKIPSYRKFKLSEIGLSTPCDLTFITSVSRVDGSVSGPYNNSKIWGRRRNSFIHNNGNSKIKCNKTGYTKLSFAEVGTCPIIKRGNYAPSWGIKRYSSIATNGNNGIFNIRLNNGNIEISKNGGAFETIIYNRSIIILDLQAGGGYGGKGAGSSLSLTYVAMAGGGAGGSGAFGSFIIDLADVDHNTIAVYVGKGYPNNCGTNQSYVYLQKNNVKYTYKLNGGGNGGDAWAYSYGLWGNAGGGEGGSGGTCDFPNVNLSCIEVLSKISGLKGQDGDSCGGGVGFASGGASSYGSQYGNDVILKNDLGSDIQVNSVGSGGYGVGGGLGFTHSKGGAASVMGDGGMGGNGDEYPGEPGTRGAGGGGGAGTIWLGGSTGGAGGDGYMVIH